MAVADGIEYPVIIMPAAKPASLSVSAPDDGPRLTAPQARERIVAAASAVNGVLRGQNRTVDTVLAAVLARGHVLLEDVPGVGKTTLARAIARVMGHSFSRIQFTADMLPSDVLGAQVLDGGDFVFKPGPLFSQVVLADEINRASPKTQSAMLEAMAEGSATVDEQTYRLPQPFLVIATQNPVEHHGAYPLPESQMDRFGVGLSLGYPEAADERELLRAPNAPARSLEGLEPCFDSDDLQAVQKLVDQVELSETVADYPMQIVTVTRQHADIVLGCSPRGSMVYANLCRARAFMQGRSFVTPDDVKALAGPALGHRLVIAARGGTSQRSETRELIAEIMQAISVPR